MGQAKLHKVICSDCRSNIIGGIRVHVLRQRKRGRRSNVCMECKTNVMHDLRSERIAVHAVIVEERSVLSEYTFKDYDECVRWEKYVHDCIWEYGTH